MNENPLQCCSLNCIMPNQSSFRIKVIKSGDDFYENAYITYCTSQAGVVTNHAETTTNFNQRFMTLTTSHSSPVKITPVPSVPILYDDNRLLSFVKKHISDQAESATLYLEPAYNHLKSCQNDQMIEMRQKTFLIWFIGAISMVIGFFVRSTFSMPTGICIMFLGFFGAAIGYFLFVNRTYTDKDVWENLIHQRIYKKLGYTGLEHGNNTSPYQLNTSRFELDNSFEA